MIEIKLTNGDEVRNMDDAHLALWVFKMADLIKSQNITEINLCEWLGMDAGACCKVIPDSQPVPVWKEKMMQRFSRRV